MDYKCNTELSKLKEYIGSSSIVAFDIETAPTPAYRHEDKAALDPFKSHIVGVSFSVAQGSAVYVPMRHLYGVNMDSKEMEIYLSSLMQDASIIKVAHNLSFEAMFLYHLGIVVQPPCYDTIAASQMTLKNSTQYRALADSGLKTLVPELFDVALPSFETVTSGRHFDELDVQKDETINYACSDSDYTLRLYRTFNSWFDRFLPKHRLIVENVESPTAIYVGMMKHNGLLMDKSLMTVKQTEAEEKLAELKGKIAFIIGDVDIGANAATSAFKKFLYKDLHLPVLKTTAKFQEAADDEAMILLADWCKEYKPELAELFELVQEYRKWGKIKSTYIDGYIQHINDATGRIHPNLMPLTTETGRFASRNPNLQNCPRKDNDPIGIRNMIISPIGSVILSLDLSQIELRVGAFYCRDEKMLDTYRADGDIHAQTTSVIYRIPFMEALDKKNEHYKERRTIAKNCNFGVFFGLFPRGLQRTLKFKAGLDTQLSECENIINNLKSGYPMLASWQESTKNKATFRKYTETWLGRRRYLPQITSTDWGKKSFAERCALNTPIQGTAADILKLAMGRIVAGLPERPWLKPLLQIHDELVFEVPENKVNEAARFIKNCMEAQPFDEFDVPIVAEASVGVNFGEMKELEDYI